jgi:hypothetical protein
MAAGSGSALDGAKLLLAFGLGTLPVMLSFGLLASLASARLAPKIQRFSGIVIIALGTIMLNRGLVLSGAGFDFTTGLAWTTLQIREHWSVDMSMPVLGYQLIEMDISQQSAPAQPIILQKGVPVKWKIHNQEAQSCVSSILAPKLGLDIPIKKGEQTIEFTPQQAGVITWSCNMGMTTGSFVVIDKQGKAKEEQ